MEPVMPFTPIKNCPMCGSKPALKENYTTVGGHLFSGVVCDRCGLAGLNFSTQGGIDMWQEMVSEWEKIESLLEEEPEEEGD
jgi:hypothetical protein